MEELDPQTLWRRFGAGDRRAFTALYRRYEDDVLRFCQALVRDPDDAREAANSTWAAVWSAPHAAQRDIPLRPWLFRIAHNQAIDVLRARRPHEPLDVTVAAPDDPAADAELHERLAILRADLMELSDHQRTALVLREMRGLGHHEIAAVLGSSVAAAKQTIYEARQALIVAESGRSLACDVVRREVSTGDRRILRGRRIRAHLRGCEACREYAAAVERRRRDLKMLLPVPGGVALLMRLLPQASLAGGGGSAAAGLPSLGLTFGGPIAAKLATAAVVIAVGAGAAGGGQRAPGIGDPRSTAPPSPVVRASPTHPTARSPAAPSPPARTTPAPPPRATRRTEARPAAPPAHVAPAASVTPAATVRQTPTTPAEPAAEPAATPVTVEARPPRPIAEATDAPATPPDEAERDPGTPSHPWPEPAAATPPPGQARQDPSAPDVAAVVSPAQTRPDPAATATRPSQVKDRPDATRTPPGQAEDGTVPPASAHPPSRGGPNATG